MALPSQVEVALEGYVEAEWTAAFPIDKLVMPQEHFDPDPLEPWARLDVLHGEGRHLGWRGPRSEWVEPGVLQLTLSVPIGVRDQPEGLDRIREYEDFVSVHLRGKRVPIPGDRGVYLFERSIAELPTRTDARFYQRVASVRFEWYSETSAA